MIIGGSGGIGRACVWQLAQLGAQLVVHGGGDRRRLQALLDELRQAGYPAKGFSRAIAPHKRTETLLRALKRLPPADILVVGFGPLLERPLIETSPAEWRRMLDLNLVLPAALIVSVLPAMLAGNFGRIVLFGVAGVERLRGYREIPAYAAAKAGLADLVRSVALLTNGHNVTINAICPGYVHTEYSSPRQLERYRRRVPGGELLAPDKIAAEVARLAQPAAAAINGELLAIQ